MIAIPLALLLGGLLFLAGFLVGWDFAVHAYRAEKRRLQAATADLETQIDTLREEAQRDPQRAWIDVGKTSVLTQLEALARHLRHTLQADE